MSAKSNELTTFNRFVRFLVGFVLIPFTYMTIVYFGSHYGDHRLAHEMTRVWTVFVVLFVLVAAYRGMGLKWRWLSTRAGRVTVAVAGIWIMADAVLDLVAYVLSAG